MLRASFRVTLLSLREPHTRSASLVVPSNMA